MRAAIVMAALFLSALLACAARQPAPGAAQPPRPVPPALRVSGTGLKDTGLSPADLAAMPRRTVTVKERETTEAKYEGVAVQELLSKAGMGFGQALRGARLRDYLLAESADGYAVVFALPEVAEEFSDRVVIVADRVDGAPISGRDGPLRVVVSDEKKHARWVRNVVSLTVRTAPPEPPAR